MTNDGSGNNKMLEKIVNKKQSTNYLRK